MKRLCWLFCECLITVSLLVSPKSGSCSETIFTYLICLSYKTNEKNPFCRELCKTKLELKHRNPRFHSTLERFDVSGWFRASPQSPCLFCSFDCDFAGRKLSPGTSSLLRGTKSTALQSLNVCDLLQTIKLSKWFLLLCVLLLF